MSKKLSVSGALLLDLQTAPSQTLVTGLHSVLTMFAKKLEIESWYLGRLECNGS